MLLSSSSCFKEEAKRNRCRLFNKTILVHCQIQIMRLWSLHLQPLNNQLLWPPPTCCMCQFCCCFEPEIFKSIAHAAASGCQRSISCAGKGVEAVGHRGGIVRSSRCSRLPPSCAGPVWLGSNLCVCVWVGTCLARCHPSGPEQLFYQHFQSFLDVNSLHLHGTPVNEL